MGDTKAPLTATEWAARQQTEDHAQGVRDGAIPGPRPAPECPDCGLAGDIHPTYYGWWTRLEPEDPEPLLPHTVPPRQRWHVDTGGSAWNTQDDEPLPMAVCQISHHIVCPRTERPDLTPWLTARTEANRLRAELLEGRQAQDDQDGTA
ncbi:DUF6083 domain-containing protein [Streptomyces sp. NPDC048411]|uniref:DUF6083 domain-containing protein n=1 Tax=Streptomyces sp. NPDC048411 TaxID=3157206 RepID=UPI00345228FF